MSASSAPPVRLWPRPFWAWLGQLDPLLKDGALGVAVFVGSAVQLGAGSGFGSAPATLVAMAVISAMITVRRRHPVAAPVVSGVAIVVQEALDGKVTNGADASFVAFLLLLYGLGAYCELRVAVAAGAACWLLLLGDTFIDDFSNSAADLLFITMFVAATITVGRAIRNRRLLNRALRGRAERLEAERDDRARKAVADERRRIAAELHDVVTHAVSSMVVQAGAVRHVVHRDPSAAGATLGDIELTGRDALAEMRRLLGVLRRDDDPEALAPQPGMARLDELAGRARRAGLDVSLERTGEEVPLSPGLDLVAYRVVEEALQGATRGAGTTRVEVRVAYGERALDLEIADDGGERTRAALDTDPQLVSIRERVALFGGEFHAEPERAGGFRVRARLPIERMVTA